MTYETDLHERIAMALERIADSLDRLTTAAPALMSVLDINGPTAAAAAVKAATAPKTDDNAWIDWPGGECPVPDGTRVDIRYRDGRYYPKAPAELMGWNAKGNATIVAYRISK